MTRPKSWTVYRTVARTDRDPQCHRQEDGARGGSCTRLAVETNNVGDASARGPNPSSAENRSVDACAAPCPRLTPPSRTRPSPRLDVEVIHPRGTCRTTHLSIVVHARAYTAGPAPELQPVQDCGRLLNRLAVSLLSCMLDVPSRVQWNIIVSPIALTSALASLVAGCEGPTKEDLCNLLRLKPQEVEVIVERFKTESAEHTFYVANRMFLQSNCPLLATFRSQIEAKYMTTAQNVDFESPDQTYVRAINEWCSNATNGKVPAVVTRKTFGASSSMVLVSAVYFKGLWKDKFYPNATHMMKFYVSRADTLDVRMMTRTGRFPYAEVPSLRIRALEVPYRTGKLSMVLVRQ
ncbi:hypothetical protein HPB52_020657 [Rhipicephalus sanguineus]|uniref:Serpin domain-containing protein n=1 Tax=Rhipicephalus sanguineus TaxID=34632 RepID=A0A9D4QAP3_RHISA|nr:hypothetical protein HPB52_020657 [Rhipicephalus sanguineus]